MRMIIAPHRGGSTTRVRLTNRFGSAPITFHSVTIAEAGDGAMLLPGTLAQVSFGHADTITLAPGRDATSDPVAFRFRAFDRLAISFYLASYRGLPTEHFTARQTSFYTDPGAGDRASDVVGAAFTHRTTSWYYLAGLDVRAPGGHGTVVAFGDSLTDGFQGPPTMLPENGATLGTNQRWPDVLQRRLDAADIPLSVANAAISGNRLLAGGIIPQFGVQGGVQRFATDALTQPGITTVIVLEGTNDLGQGLPTLAQLRAGYESLVSMAHRAGVRVLLGTIPPNAAPVFLTYGHNPLANKVHQQVNTWIRSGTTGADGYVDFDAALRDPANPTRIAAEYDGGDQVHPNPAGYRAMANAVRLSDLAEPDCAPSSRSRATAGS